MGLHLLTLFTLTIASIIQGLIMGYKFPNMDRVAARRYLDFYAGLEALVIIELCILIATIMQ